MTAIHTGRAIAAALVLTLVPAAGFTATYDVVQQNDSIFDDGSGAKFVAGTIRELRVSDGRTGSRNIDTAAGAFHLSKKPEGAPDSAYEDFIAFCVEVFQTIQTSTTTPVQYTENNSLIGEDRRELMSTLLGTAFDPAQGAVHQAATQLAIWKLTYGDISADGNAFIVAKRSTENLPTDTTSLGFLGNFNVEPSGAFELANEWLAQLDGDATNGEWDRLPGQRVSFLTSESSQNLVTYTAPVPVPAAGGLLIGAIAGLAALRRRRKAA